MNVKKWIVTAAVAVVVLTLIAASLLALLVNQVTDGFDGLLIPDTPGTTEETVEILPTVAPAEEATVAPAEEAVPTEPVALDTMVLGLVIPTKGNFTAPMVDAFQNACADTGYSAIIATTSGDPAEAYEAAIALMDSGVGALTVNCPDAALLGELSAIAMERGIVLVSLDLQDVYYEQLPVMLNIKIWGSPLEIGTQLLHEVAVGTNYTGRYGVIATREEDAVFDAMESVVTHYDEMKNTVWCASSHAKGTDQSIRDSISYMLLTNDLDAVVCTDPQTTQIVTEYVLDNGYDVKVFGFCPFDWVPENRPAGKILYYESAEAGILTAKAMIGILSGTLTLEDRAELNTTDNTVYILNLENGNLTFYVGPAMF